MSDENREVEEEVMEEDQEMTDQELLDRAQKVLFENIYVDISSEKIGANMYRRLDLRMKQSIVVVFKELALNFKSLIKVVENLNLNIASFQQSTPQISKPRDPFPEIRKGYKQPITQPQVKLINNLLVRYNTTLQVAIDQLRGQSAVDNRGVTRTFNPTQFYKTVNEMSKEDARAFITVLLSEG